MADFPYTNTEQPSTIMKRSTSLSILAALILGAATTDMQAQQTDHQDIPRLISYQGLLSSSDGTALPDGTYDITVTMYGDPAGTDVVWRDTYESNVVNGLFNLQLGTKAPLPASNAMNRPIWVGTSVNGADEMRPLTPLTSSPYALNLPDRAVTSDKLASGAVTADKVDMDYISGISVNGQRVSGKGTVLDIRSSDDIAVEYDKDDQTILLKAPARVAMGDNNKAGARTLAADEVWSSHGDLWNISSGATSAANSSDWIGTSGNFNFTIQVNSARVMQYQSNGTNTPNILGGHSTNSIGGGIGNVIAGGGSNTLANSIANGYDFSFIGGGTSNSISGFNSVIVGGASQVVSSDYSAILGGSSNSVSGSMSHVGTGSNNSVSGQSSSISSGSANVNNAGNSAISSGQNNTIGSTLSHNFIGAGLGNTIGDGSYSAIVSGTSNTMYGIQSFVGAGNSNNIGSSADNSSIVGGDGNSISLDNSFIGGGYTNEVQSDLSVIGAGSQNKIYDDESDGSGILAGALNEIGTALGEHGLYSVIGGGYDNTIIADYASVVGGEENVINPTGDHSFIGGGGNNTIDNTFGFIGAGSTNTNGANRGMIGAGFGNELTNSTSGGDATNSVIGGGNSNKISDIAGFIGGGENNAIAFGGYSGVIGGGRLNEVYADGGVVGGGYTNSVQSTQSFIGSGAFNTVQGATDFGVIGGGTGNLIVEGSQVGAIGGGAGNRIDGTGMSYPHLMHGTIPGGDNLISQSYAQTVLGAWNLPKGSMSGRQIIAGDTRDPIVIVGSGYWDDPGQTMQRFNAFEVSYDGHSVVYDENGTGTAPSGKKAIRGATYTDNVIYSWGNAVPNTMAQNVNIECDFGVRFVQYLGIGHYQFTMAIEKPNDDGTFSPMFIDCGSVTATLLYDASPEFMGCAFIKTTRVSGNKFDVYIFDQNCNHIDMPFTFKVTGRPSE